MSSSLQSGVGGDDGKLCGCRVDFNSFEKLHLPEVHGGSSSGGLLVSESSRQTLSMFCIVPLSFSPAGLKRVGTLTRVVERVRLAQTASISTCFLTGGWRTLNPREDRPDPTAGTG